MSNGGAQLFKVQIRNSSDAIVPLADVYHYDVGTTDTQVVWTDEAKTTPAAQPVVAGADGEVEFYADGELDIKAFNSGEGPGGTPVRIWENKRITKDTGTMWEGNKGTAYPAASAANKGHMFALVDGSDNLLEVGINATGSAFTPIAHPVGKGADIASAATLIIPKDGDYHDVTGTTGITAIQAKRVGTFEWLHFDGILTLTHHATNLILPGGNNITTSAGYEALFIEYASGQWRLISDNKSVTLQSAYNIIISTDPGANYATMAAYIADSPTAGDRVLIKVDEVLIATLSIPADIEVTQLKGNKFTLATNFSPVIQFGDNVKTKGDFRVENSDTGTIAKGFSINGDNNHHDNLVIENTSTGTITGGVYVESGAEGNYAQGRSINSGGGAIANDLTDASTNDENQITVIGDTVISRSKGANRISEIVKWSKGADIASAAALAPGDDGNYFDVTGTTGITSISTKGVGTEIKLHFDGILTLTHHATDLVLPGGANITTAAGDEYTFTEYDAGKWRLTAFSGSSFGAIQVTDLSVTGSAASPPDANTLVKENIVKAWVNFNGSAGTPTPINHYNVSSITDNGAGDYVVVFDRDFGDIRYAIGVSSQGTHSFKGAHSVGSVPIFTANTSHVLTNYEHVTVIAIGDQT